MNSIRTIFFLAFAAFTFVSSIGLSVFTHFCHEDGIEQFYVIPQKNCCEAKEEIEIACCDHAVQLEESDCCSDQVSYYQYDFESFEHHSFFHFDFLTSVKPCIYSYFPVEKLASTRVYNLANPPPKKWGLALLIQNQVFRI